MASIDICYAVAAYNLVSEKAHILQSLQKLQTEPVLTMIEQYRSPLQ